MNNHVVFICDNEYVLPTCVAIRSLCENVRDPRLFVIHILSWGITEYNKELIRESTVKGATIDFNDAKIEDYYDYLNQIEQKSHVTPVALLKFEIANYIFEDIVLYLDSDLIIKKDITELFNIKLDGYVAGASFELMKYINQFVEKKDRSIPKFYFNSGVMLLNLKLIREEKLDVELWRTKIEGHNGRGIKKNLMDQDTLNEVFEERVHKLSIIYNCNTRFVKNIDIRLVNTIYKTTFVSKKDLLNEACILHYVGKNDKPWVYDNGSCHKIWENYYNLLDFNYELNRKHFKKDIRYYYNIVKSYIKKDGIKAVFRYLNIKISGI